MDQAEAGGQAARIRHTHTSHGALEQTLPLAGGGRRLLTTRLRGSGGSRQLGAAGAGDDALPLAMVPIATAVCGVSGVVPALAPLRSRMKATMSVVCFSLRLPPAPSGMVVWILLKSCAVVRLPQAPMKAGPPSAGASLVPARSGRWQ